MRELASITEYDINLLDCFLRKAGDSLLSFRYFSKRDISCLKNHLVTYILIEENSDVAYGHLDSENGKVWLGVCVAEKEKHKGYGNFMVKSLLDFGREHNVKNIYLSVDKDNIQAKSLYKKFGFKSIEEKGNIEIYELEEI